MTIRESTAAYETWLGRRIALFPADLALKHRRMAADPFSFLRGTYYRWAQLWPALCAELNAAPLVVAVGDLHVANFGTWRDPEGRLIWGVNDLDETYPLPYTGDLVRLATSARLSIEIGHLSLPPQDACDAILDGYCSMLERGGRPFILTERHRWLRLLVRRIRFDPARFWARLRALPDHHAAVPIAVLELLGQLMPERGHSYIMKRRAAGVGSLGRRRFVALLDWEGGFIAREAKELIVSAAAWAAGAGHSDERYGMWVRNNAVHIADPFLAIGTGWVVRRLAPDCQRIDLVRLRNHSLERRLLRAMGQETANLHLASAKHVPAILGDLRYRSNDWLHRASRLMGRAVADDWRDWKRALRRTVG
ncbi:MAG: DUF2252 family protein [Bacteroidetes bacterium]|nr:DUF2252 family protein [Bacteroidota bacterium]